MRLLIIFALASGLTSEARAQDGSEVLSRRTPVSAQNFLTIMPPAYLLYLPKAPSGGIATEVVMPVQSSGSTLPCVTELRLMPSDGNLLDRWTIDWSKVEGITEDKGLLQIAYPSLWPDESAVGFFRLRYNSEEARNRAMAAMLFLKSACDKAAETGF